MEQLTNKEKQNAIDNINGWILQKESLAEMYGKNTWKGMTCMSDISVYHTWLDKLKNI